MKVFWIIWLCIGLLAEIGALVYMWLRRENAKTLTQVIEPWIRYNWATRALWWAGAIVVTLHLTTGWF